MNRLALLLRGRKIAQREWVLWESSFTRRGSVVQVPPHRFGTLLETIAT